MKGKETGAIKRPSLKLKEPISVKFSGYAEIGCCRRNFFVVHNWEVTIKINSIFVGKGCSHTLCHITFRRALNEILV